MNQCSETTRLSYAASSILSTEEVEALTVHLEQCTICQEVRKIMVEGGPTFKTAFTEEVFPEWGALESRNEAE